MIQEIINFVDTLPQEVFTNNLHPKEGLYILLNINEDGNLMNVITEDLVGKYIDGFGGIHEKDLSDEEKDRLEKNKRTKLTKVNIKGFKNLAFDNIKVGMFIDGFHNLFDENLEKKQLRDLSQRLRKAITKDNVGEILPASKVLYADKKGEMPELVKKCLPLWMNTVPVSNAKIFNPIKKVFGNTCSPFAFSFNKKNWEKYDLYNLYLKKIEKVEPEKKDKAIASLSKEEGFKKLASDLNPLISIPADQRKDVLNARFHEFMRGELTIYFDASEHFIVDEEHQNWMKLFRNYLYNHIFTLIDRLTEFEELKSAEGIYFFLKSPALEDYEKPYQEYLSKKVFNKDDYNKTKSSTGEIHGISDSVSYFNDKKPFLKHLSAPLLYNYRVTGKEAMKVWQFFNMYKNRQLPNPMPIFIDKKELTETAVKIFNDEKGKLGYVELIKRMLEKGDDLSSYYLMFFDVRAKKSKIIDLDFVPIFRYKMNDAKIVEVFSLSGDLLAKTKVENVFDFEYKIINRFFFNHQLMPKESWRRYFDEMEAHKMSANTYNQLMKYRKACYNYIFKSQRQAITKMMFDDIMLKGVFDDIRLDDKGSNDYSIKAKLNIWFSLYEYFDYTQFNKPLNKKSMVNKTEELISRISTVATNKKEHLRNDDEFAFAAGQIIHFLLNKSEAGNRTHALLEPFLQKTNAALLKREIARSFDMYKHAIKFYALKYEFDKIMSEVMGYEPDEKNMKNLLPSTLAGYFAKSTFSKKSNK